MQLETFTIFHFADLGIKKPFTASWVTTVSMDMTNKTDLILRHLVTIFSLKQKNVWPTHKKSRFLTYCISCLYAPAIAYPRLYMSPQLEDICKNITSISWLFIVTSSSLYIWQEKNMTFSLPGSVYGLGLLLSVVRSERVHAKGWPSS